MNWAYEMIEEMNKISLIGIEFPTDLKHFYFNNLQIFIYINGIWVTLETHWRNV